MALAPFQDYDLDVEGGYGFAGQECSVILSKGGKFIAESYCFEELIKKVESNENSNEN